MTKTPQCELTSYNFKIKSYNYKIKVKLWLSQNSEKESHVSETISKNCKINGKF